MLRLKWGVEARRADEGDLRLSDDVANSSRTSGLAQCNPHATRKARAADLLVRPRGEARRNVGASRSAIAGRPIELGTTVAAIGRKQFGAASRHRSSRWCEPCEAK